MLCMVWPQLPGGMGFTIWHFQSRPKISQKHQKCYESDSSTDVPEIFSYISSNISRVEAAGFPGVSDSEKSLYPQENFQENFQEQTSFSWRNPDVKLGEQVTEKPLNCLEGPAWAPFFL